jgi:hypothetical protein
MMIWLIWLPGLLLSIVAAVSAMWTQQLLPKVRLELAQIPSTMRTRADAHSIQRGFEMAEMLHHVSVVLLLIALVLFLYSMDRAVAISILTLVVPYLVAQLKQSDFAYSVWWRW